MGLEVDLSIFAGTLSRLGGGVSRERQVSLCLRRRLWRFFWLGYGLLCGPVGRIFRRYVRLIVRVVLGCGSLRCGCLGRGSLGRSKNSDQQKKEDTAGFHEFYFSPS